MGRRAGSNDFADAGRAGEINPAHGGMIDQRPNDFGCILGRVAEDIQNPRRQACVGKSLPDQAMGERAKLRGFQNGGIATGERGCNGPDAQNNRSVPRGHPQDHAKRLAHGKRHTAGFIAWDDLAIDLRGERGGLADHIGGKGNVEHRPALCRAGLGRHRRHESLGSAN